ncbi:MAG: hypothetical protein STSR0004_21320 [Peptococcaceae bacterium]
MDTMTLLQLLLISLPEGMLVAALGITLTGFKPRLEQLLFITKVGLAEAKNINLEILIKCSLRNLPLKSGEANSILGNLLDNAMEAVENAAGERRLITVELSREPGAFNFTVANRGEPIKPGIIDQIFEPYFSTKEGRQGLGLTIIKEVAEHYNGSVTVSSNNEETIFAVRIPSKK